MEPNCCTRAQHPSPQLAGSLAKVLLPAVFSALLGRKGLCAAPNCQGIGTAQRSGLQGTDCRYQLQRVMVLLGTKYSPMLKTHQLPQLPHQQLSHLGWKGGSSLQCMWITLEQYGTMETKATRSRKVTLKVCPAWVHELWTLSRNTKTALLNPCLLQIPAVGSNSPAQPLCLRECQNWAKCLPSSHSAHA